MFSDVADMWRQAFERHPPERRGPVVGEMSVDGSDDGAGGGSGSERTRTEREGIVRVSALTAALAVVAAGLLLWCDCVTGTALPARWWIAIAIGAGFGLAERFVFHIEYRREAISVSLSEVPSVFALAFLAPAVAIPVRVICSVGLIWVMYRPKPYKLVFNAALFTFEAALAFVIARAIVGPDEFVAGPFLVAVAIGVVASTFVGALMVSVAIAAFEGGLGRRLLGEVKTNLVIGPISALIAAVALAPALFGIEYALLSLVPVVAVWLVLLRYGRLTQHHRDLEAVHDFASVAGGSLAVAEVAPAAVAEVVRLLRAEAGVLQVYGRDGRTLLTCSSGGSIDEAPTGCDDVRWSAVFALGTAAWWSRGPDGAVVVDLRQPADRMVVPLVDDVSALGLLTVAGKAGVGAVFDESDLQRAEALGAQLSIALGKALLHADMEHAAMHDVLTGDPNRATFDRIVTDALHGGGGTRGVHAVLMLDLDQFKEVNDTLGHHVGDRVLVEFASRMRNLVDPDDVFARFGGDEFALYVHRPDVASVREFANRILSEAHLPLALDGYDIVVTVSVGIAIVTEYDRDAASLMRRADIAMYAAKRQHIGFEVYREEIDRRTPERLSLLGDLREVLDVGGLAIHLQPKVDLSTSTVVGAEALARWQHPTRGWVAPDEFIRVAEETGLIRQLTDQVLTMSMQIARTWGDAGHDLAISVNLSTLDLLDELLPERIAHRLEQHALAPDRLIIEITESSLMADTPRTMSTIDRLHRLGVGLSLDDFGTGYSSLSYLRRLPVTELKIDRSFVTNLVLDTQDEVIVRSTIELGHNLGLRVVAEGIENDPILERLRSLGCDLGQGFGIARPLAPELFDRWLATTPYVVPGRPGRDPEQCAGSVGASADD